MIRFAWNEFIYTYVILFSLLKVRFVEFEIKGGSVQAADEFDIEPSCVRLCELFLNV